MTVLPHELKWLTACSTMAPLFSTCSRRQYFAVVLASNKRVAGIGYNGAPPGVKHCIDGGCPRANSTVQHGSSYDTPDGFCIAQHAEAGALLWSDPGLRKDGTIIVNGPPCMDCARLIASSGVKRVVHVKDEAYSLWPTVQGFLEQAGVTTVAVDRNDITVPGDDRIELRSESGELVAVLEGEQARPVYKAGVELLVRQWMESLVDPAQR